MLAPISVFQASEPTAPVIRRAVKLHGELLDNPSKQLLALWIKENIPQRNGATHSIVPAEYLRPFKRHRKKNKTEPKMVPYNGPKRWGNSNEKFIKRDSTDLIPLTPDQRIEVLAGTYGAWIAEALMDDHMQRMDEIEKMHAAEEMLVEAGVEDGDWRGDNGFEEESDDDERAAHVAEELFDTTTQQTTPTFVRTFED